MAHDENGSSQIHRKLIQTLMKNELSGGGASEMGLKTIQRAASHLDDARHAGDVRENTIRNAQHLATAFIAREVEKRVSGTGLPDPLLRKNYEKIGSVVKAAEREKLLAQVPGSSIIHDVATPHVQDAIERRTEKAKKPKQLESSYKRAGKLLTAAVEAGLVDEQQIQELLRVKLEPNLKRALEAAFGSGKWNQLALQRVAEQSRLFSRESMEAVRVMVITMLRESLEKSIQWGDAREAKEKLQMARNVGIISDSDVKKLTEYYLLESRMK